MDASTREFMESRFGHDFTRVRVHTDARAAVSAQAVNARAYTVGPNLVFGAMQYNPETTEGRRLLAHELTHVVQQSGMGRTDAGLQRQAALPGEEETNAMPYTDEDREKDQAPATGAAESSTDEVIESQEGMEEEEEPLAKFRAGTPVNATNFGSNALEREADAQAHTVMAGGRAVVRLRAGRPGIVQRYSATLCGRASTQFPDFPETYISTINVDVTSPDHPVQLVWTGPNAARGETGPFHSSPGAGLCRYNCDDVGQSQTDGSHCTPKGTRNVERYACALSSDSRATNATFFHQTRGIAIHYFPSVPNYPASHGCVRMADLHVAQLIYDNTRRPYTTVNVTGTWTRGTRRGRPVCY